MSIIYDALKKTQAQRAAADFEKLMVTPVAESPVIPATVAADTTTVSPTVLVTSHSDQAEAQPQEAVRHYMSRSTVLLIVMVIVMSVALAHLSLTHVPAPQPVIAKPLPPHLHKLKMQLDGVFLGGKDKRAMINHNLFSEGEQIDGLRIVAIEEERVKLQDDQHTLELHMR